MDRAHLREQIRRLLARRDREGLTYRKRWLKHFWTYIPQISPLTFVRREPYSFSEIG